MWSQVTVRWFTTILLTALFFLRGNPSLQAHYTYATLASLPVRLRSHGNGSLTPFKCLLVSVNIENGLRPREDIIKSYYHLSQSNGKYLVTWQTSLSHDIMSYQAFSVLVSDTNTCYSTWVYRMHVTNTPLRRRRPGDEATGGRSEINDHVHWYRVKTDPAQRLHLQS